MIIHRLSLVAAGCAPAHAAEIKVMSTNALKTVLEDLGPKFDQSSGHKLAIATAKLMVQMDKAGAM
jgi:hypothetical protein